MRSSLGFLVGAGLVALGCATAVPVAQEVVGQSTVETTVLSPSSPSSTGSSPPASPEGPPAVEGAPLPAPDPTAPSTESTDPSTSAPPDSSDASPSTEPPEPPPSAPPGTPEVVPLRFVSEIDDVSAAELEAEALAILNDERGWGRAGFTFVADPDAPYRVVLAEGARVDELCLPLDTGSFASCQNGPVVALNADRWRSAVTHWDGDLAGYRGYLVNHEVGHLIGMRHPAPRCPVAGAPAGVMEQQTGGLHGCTGNAWPRDWEIAYASVRPVVYAPLPDWGPDPIPANLEGQ